MPTQTQQAVAAAFADLQRFLDKRVTNSEVQCEHHSRGESHHESGLPDIVCFPHSTEEVSRIVKTSGQYGLPVIPFGAGTSLEGQVNAIHGGISIDMREMNHVLRLSPEDADVTVGAGITRVQLVKALENTGLTFYIDPGADATIGGMVSTRASGTTSVKFGTMAENVLALTVVLADGRVVRTRTRARKSSAGYDLTHLFIGAEGTLGVITEVTLRLHPLPEHLAVAVCCFQTIDNAIETVIEAIQLGVDVARIEFIDEKQVEAINRYSKMSLKVLPTLLFELHGISQNAIGEQAEILRSLAEEHGGMEFQWQNTPEAREELWRARHDAYFATCALLPGAKVYISDVCVPISRLAACIHETKADLMERSFAATILGHVGDGNFHVLCVLDPNDEKQFEEARQFSDRSVARALSMGGTCTGEHGIGIGKQHYLREELGDAVDVMKSIKLALDPENRMNPGKTIPLD